MDLIKLYPSTSSPTALNRGEYIKGYTSALWVERYRDAGEFKIVAPLSSGLREFLPVDTFVSHLDTEELMIVENHEIETSKDADSTITISGRSFESYLEQRIAGDWMPSWTYVIPAEWVLTADDTWSQIVDLITWHFIDVSGVGGDSDDEVANLEVEEICTGTGTSEARPIRFQTIYSLVNEIMKIDDLGIRTSRPNSSRATIKWTIHQGTDVSDTVRFSWMSGDLDDIKYLATNKNRKNRARYIGRWLNGIVGDGTTTPTGFDRRTMIVDTAYVDEKETAEPSGGALTLLVIKMAIQAQQELRGKNDITILAADVSENTPYRFRRDYNIGDLVSVHGDFGATTVMRVTEYAEAEDESGTTGHPTLAVPGED